MDIEIRTSELAEILRTNREKHIETYREARVKYRTRMLQRLERASDRVEAWKPEGEFDPPEVWKLLGELPTPENFAHEYDRAIEMVGHQSGETITLSERDYERLVQDSWSWKRQWENNTLSYAGRELT